MTTPDFAPPPPRRSADGGGGMTTSDFAPVHPGAAPAEVAA